MGDQLDPPAADQDVLRSAERLKFFTDAVVAIAMTLLILPLLESVSEAAAEGLDTAQYFDEHGSQLFAFVLSFVIIASFWIDHERLFAQVDRWTSPLMLMNVGWMLSIVFLPVITALVGTLDVDRAQIAIYLGTMTITSALMAGMNLVVRRTPTTWAAQQGPPIGDLVARIVMTALYVVSLVVAVAFPGVNYYALFLLFLAVPVRRLLRLRAARG